VSKVSGYTHSETFASLKTHKETITDNLSSHQYLQTLDMLIWNALTPIVYECPTLIHGIFAKFCARQTRKPNTKMTSDLKEKLPVILFNALNEPDPAKALVLYKSLYFNRGLLFGTLTLFLSKGREYAKLHSAFHDAQNPVLHSKLRALELQLGARSSSGLYAAVRQVEYWDKKARTWRGMIIEKYTRTALMAAKRTYVDYAHKMKLDDVVQIHLMMVGKAIDRCDARLGVLTTFVNPWLKGARSQVDEEAKEQGLESLEDLQERTDMEIVTEFDTFSEDLEHLAYKSRILDPVGLVRTLLGIPQWVNAVDRQTLMAFALEPKKNV
jgi:hypothetical protein